MSLTERLKKTIKETYEDVVDRSWVVPFVVIPYFTLSAFVFGGSYLWQKYYVYPSICEEYGTLLDAERIAKIEAEKQRIKDNFWTPDHMAEEYESLIYTALKHCK